MSIDFSLKILIVDSDGSQLESLATQLTAEGFAVVTAPDGESAILAFEEHAPDLVLLERSLPGLDGSEVCEALKERSGNTFIPIVFLAAVENPEDKTAGYDAGADDFIVKPYDFKELVARIKSLRKIQGIANRDQRTLTGLTYQRQQRSYDEVMKVVADNLGPDKKVLYRFTLQGMPGYLATEGFRFVHARLGDLTGRAAIEKMLVWPAVQLESVTFFKLRPNVDIDFDELVTWFSIRLDWWRFVVEKLPAKETVLEANALRRDDVLNLPSEFGAIYRLFYSAISLDEAARKSPIGLPETFKAVGELFYRGLLLRTAPPAAADDDALSPSVFAAAYATSDAGETTQSLEELQFDVLTLVDTNKQLAEELAALKKKIEIENPNLERILSEREQVAATTAARLAELDTAMVALKRRYASRLKDIATKSNDGIIDSVVEQLSMDLQDAHSFAVTVQHSKLNAERQLAALREEHGSLKAALDETTKAQERLLQQQQHANVHEGSRLHQLQAEVGSLKTQLSESSANRKALQEQLQGASRQSDSKVLKHVQDEVAQLRSQLAEAHQQRQALRDKVEQNDLVTAEAQRKILEENQTAKSQLAEAVKSRDLLQQKLAQAVLDEASKVQLYEQEIAQLKAASAEAGSNPEVLFPEGAPAADPLQLQLLEHKLSDLVSKQAVLQDSFDQAEQALVDAETKSLFLEQEAAQLRPALAQAELSVSQFQRKVAEQEALLAEHPNQLAALEEEKRALEMRLADALEKQTEVSAQPHEASAEDALQLQNLEEEIALIKSALTESMVKSDKLESQLQAAAELVETTVHTNASKIEALEATLQAATQREEELKIQLSQGSDSDSAKSQQLEKELAFVKAKFAELQASSNSKIQQYDKYSAGLKVKLEEATETREALERKLNEGIANSGAQLDVQKETAASKKLIFELKDQVELLSQKLDIANQAGNKNTLMTKAQDLADKFHMLKTTAKEQAAEIERLQAALSEAGGGEAEPGAASPEAQAKVEELTKKIDALRMALLERDEEIVELTAQIETFETAGN